MFPTLTGLPAHPSVFLPRAPPKPGSQLHLTTAGWRGRLFIHQIGALGAPLPPPDPCLGPWDLPRGIKLFLAARGRGCLGRGGREDGAAAYLGSAVLRRECRGLFVPGLPAQNWGSPCRRLPSQTPPRTRPQPPALPPSGPPSAAGVVFVAAAEPEKF